MRCDSRTVCSQCSIYLWKPTMEPRYYQFCRVCKNDILCDRGIINSFEYDENLNAEAVVPKCLVCRTPVDDRMWPPEPTGPTLEMADVSEGDSEPLK